MMRALVWSLKTSCMIFFEVGSLFSTSVIARAVAALSPSESRLTKSTICRQFSIYGLVALRQMRFNVLDNILGKGARTKDFSYSDPFEFAFVVLGYNAANKKHYVADFSFL